MPDKAETKEDKMKSKRTDMLHVFYFLFALLLDDKIFLFWLYLDTNQILPVCSGIVAHKVQLRARIESTL